MLYALLCRIYVFLSMSVGSPSAPGISVTLRDFASGSVNVQLTPPVYGRECLSEYVVEYDESYSYRMTGTRTSAVISNLDLCFQGHNFTAFGVTPGVPNGTRSISVNFGHGKYTFYVYTSLICTIHYRLLSICSQSCTNHYCYS